MTSATKEAIQFIKNAGFTHIKFELEGDIGRDGDRECADCSGSGEYNCADCDGEGALETGSYTRISGDTIFEECSSCMGEGVGSCGSCDGSGNRGSYYDEDTCEDFMRSHVPPEVNARLNYGNFYEDGSVDSEFTFTIPIDNLDDFHHWVAAFKALAEQECGTNIDVHGAGMHITVMRGGDYESLLPLPRARVANFTREVSKLLPALFFIASAGHQSRGLNYRRPQISGRDKYSAIFTHGGRCIEYRLFETCYERPDAIYEYIQAIANTLKFYANSRLTVKELGKHFGFIDGHGAVARFYNTPEQLRILNATIKELKPKDKTFKKLKEERGVKYTIKSLTLEEKRELSEFRKEFGTYANNWHKIITEPFTPSQQREYDHQITFNARDPQEARRRAKGLDILTSFEDFVERNRRNNQHYSDVMVAV